MIHKNNPYNPDQEHYLISGKDKIYPKYIIRLPFSNDEEIEEQDVTCVYSILNIQMTLKCVGIKYHEKIDNKILLRQEFGKYIPNFVYVFDGQPFDIEEKSRKLIRE